MMPHCYKCKEPIEIKMERPTHVNSDGRSAYSLASDDPVPVLVCGCDKEPKEPDIVEILKKGECCDSGYQKALMGDAAKEIEWLRSLLKKAKDEVITWRCDGDCRVSVWQDLCKDAPEPKPVVEVRYTYLEDRYATNGKEKDD